ncbi:MAG: DUF309 domain-containing protein [Chloroflexi bacterium]|nr:DUF309 domain-containing protein [Chloroflexota bacterium]
MSDQRPPTPPEESPERPGLQEALAEAIAFYNAGQFWHCHEVLEQVWLHQGDEEMRTFLKGIIQAAAAFHKGTVQHNPRGVVRNLTKALDKLIPYQPAYLGLELKEFIEGLQYCRAVAASLIDQHETDFDRVLVPPLRWVSRRGN